jgi:hypothetical protein
MLTLPVEEWIGNAASVVSGEVSPPSAPGKPGSLGKEKVAISWKFDFETQRVKVPSSQSVASRLEASLAPCWGDPLGEA